MWPKQPDRESDLSAQTGCSLFRDPNTVKADTAAGHLKSSPKQTEQTKPNKIHGQCVCACPLEAYSVDPVSSTSLEVADS